MEQEAKIYRTINLKIAYNAIHKCFKLELTF